jgi:putative multiple sugar transport system permease protein
MSLIVRSRGDDGMAAKSLKPKARRARRDRLGQYLAKPSARIRLLFALIAIMAFFQIVTDGTLLRPVNITNLLLQNSYIIIMALGMLHRHRRRPYRPVGGLGDGLHRCAGSGDDGQLGHVDLVTIPACLVVGAVIGAAQGYWIAYWKHPVLHRDAGGMLVFRGAVAVAARRPVGRTVPAEFQALSTGFVPDLLPFGRPFSGCSRAQ